MCELMALSVETAIRANFSFREFAGADEQNPDGWGIAWYPDQSAALIKEPIRWSHSQHSKFLETYHDLRSCIYIAHVRHKTVGDEPSHADTHPFLREYLGRDYAFAHNGTLADLTNDGARYRAVGATDSERAFCHLLERIAQRGGHLEDEDAYRWLHSELLTLNRRGKINCLMSDGQSLFCYHDIAGHKGLTWCRTNVAAQQPEHFQDRELQVAIESRRSEPAVLVATRSLGPGDWHTFIPGQLLVLRRGAVAFSSHAELPAVSSEVAS